MPDQHDAGHEAEPTHDGELGRAPDDNDTQGGCAQRHRADRVKAQPCIARLAAVEEAAWNGISRSVALVAAPARAACEPPIQPPRQPEHLAEVVGALEVTFAPGSSPRPGMTAAPSRRARNPALPQLGSSHEHALLARESGVRSDRPAMAGCPSIRWEPDDGTWLAGVGAAILRTQPAIA